MAAVYGVRVWNAGEHALGPTERQATHEVHHEQMPVEKPVHKPDPKPISTPTSPKETAKEEELNESSKWDLMEKPPLFERYHLAEMALPQHHVKDPFAGGKKYLWVENHVHCE